LCAPSVIEQVEQTITRRGMLAAATSAAGAIALSRAAPATATPRRRRGFSHLRDLTHVLGPDFPVYPGVTPPSYRQLSSVQANGILIYEMTLFEHSGTHFDAPAHFDADGATTDCVTASQLVAPLAVIRIADRARRDPDTRLKITDVRRWERRHGQLPQGAFVVMDSGWWRWSATTNAGTDATPPAARVGPGSTPTPCAFCSRNGGLSAWASTPSASTPRPPAASPLTASCCRPARR
jgi:Putative cyclase